MNPWDEYAAAQAQPAQDQGAPAPWDEYAAAQGGQPTPAQGQGPSDETLGRMDVRAAIGAAKPVIGAGQTWAHGGSAIADYLGAGDTMVGRGGRKIANLLDEQANKFSDWAQRGRVAAGLGEQAELFSPSTWDVPAIAGDVLSPVNLAAGGLINRGVAATRTGAKLGEGLWGRLGKGGAYGGATGLTQPVTTADLAGADTGEGPGEPKTFGEAKLGQVESGVGGGMIAGPALGIAGDIAGPRLSKSVRYLTDRGVKLSPGQTLQGILNRLEASSMSAPISGEMVRDVRGEAIHGFNRAAGNEALSHIKETLPEDIEPGHEMYNYVEDRINKKYTDIHSRVNVTADHGIVQDLSNVIQDATNSLNRPQIQHLQDLIRNNITNRFADRNGQLTGPELQTVQSKIKALSRQYISSGEKSGNPEHTAFGEYLDDARKAVDDLIARQNPAEAQALKDANRAYAHEIVLRKATAAPSAQAYEGAFTPNELGKAMNRVSPERTRARGKAFYQDLVEAGKAVIPSRVPDSATAERKAVLGFMGFEGAHQMGFAPQAIGGILAHGAAYSPPAQWLIRKALLSAPETRGPVGDFIRQYGPRAAVPMITDAIRGRGQPQGEDIGYGAQ
jgi:hypothetical protein